MASDARSMQLAEFAADSALNEARARISDVSAAHGAAHACSYLRCVIRSPTAPAEAAQFMDTPEAISATTPFRVDLAKLSGGDESARLAESPSYVIEDLGKSTPFPKGDSAPGEAPHAFHIIARGVGSTRESTCTRRPVRHRMPFTSLRAALAARANRRAWWKRFMPRRSSGPGNRRRNVCSNRVVVPT